MKARMSPVDLLVVSVVFPNDTAKPRDQEEVAVKPGADGQNTVPMKSHSSEVYP